ncbi:MAG: PEP-CTERM sorting domain-containing protein [Gammaproteobacteria bacterium]
MRTATLKTGLIASLAIGILATTTSQATVISYYLDQSNKLADGINYLQVTISDEREAGVIDFTVQALQPLLDIAGDNFGIQKFGFNIVGGVGAEAADVTLLPDSWRARNAGRMDGFGLFDLTVRGTGKSRTDTLTFSIAGVDFDTVQSYVDLSTGRTPQGFSLFAAHVAGFNSGDCVGDGKGGDDKGGSDDKKTVSGTKSTGGGGKCVTSAYFGGNGSTTVVPAPPALWLLGTGIAGLVVRRFRQGRAAIA